jgi:hypothetical protein
MPLMQAAASWAGEHKPKELEGVGFVTPHQLSIAEQILSGGSALVEEVRVQCRRVSIVRHRMMGVNQCLEPCTYSTVQYIRTVPDKPRRLAWWQQKTTKKH